jgi:alkaline phosphatase D
VTSSITSGGDGHDLTAPVRGELAENPHLRFASCRRGYVVARFDRDQLRAAFTTLPYVQRAGAPVDTAASFVVENGNPGLQRV